MKVSKPYLRTTRSVLPVYTDHKLDWLECEACPLHATRSRVVLYRGRLPASVVFLGDTPGGSEDFSGFPFTGRAGELLEDALSEAVVELGAFRYAMANVIGCTAKDGSGDVRAPTAVEAYKCSPRLKDFFENIAKPKLIIAFGPAATKFAAYAEPSAHVTELTSPATIVDMPTAKAEKAYRRFAIQLRHKVNNFVRRSPSRV